MSLDTSFWQPQTVQFPLVKHFYKACDYNVNCGRADRVFCLREKNRPAARIIAAVRFQPSAERIFIVRNLCVLPELRHKGLARKLMQLALQEMKPATIRCYALGHLQYFYETLGFSVFSPVDVPEVIARSYYAYKKQQPDLVLMGTEDRLN